MDEAPEPPQHTETASKRRVEAAERRQHRLHQQRDPILAEARQLGTLGDAGYHLILEITDAVRRQVNIPPPEGLERWDADAVAHFAMDWLWDPDRGSARVAQMLATVDSDAGLEAYLERCIVNAFATQGRATDKGARRRALRRIVRTDPRIVVLDKPWRYSTPPQTVLFPFAGDPAILTAAANEVPIGPRPTWNSDTHRRPIGASEDISSVVFAVLEAAGCPCLEWPLVLEIVLARFGVDDAKPLLQEITDAVQEVFNDPVSVSHSPEEVRVATELIWDRLSHKARVILAAHAEGQSAREIERWSGIPRSTANRHSKILDAHLRMLADMPYASAVVAELSGRSRKLAGTAETILASTEDVGTPT